MRKNPKGGKNTRCDKLLVEKEINPDCAQSKIAFAVGKNHFPATNPLIQGWMKKFKKFDATLEIRNTPAKYEL